MIQVEAGEAASAAAEGLGKRSRPAEPELSPTVKKTRSSADQDISTAPAAVPQEAIEATLEPAVPTQVR